MKMKTDYIILMITVAVLILAGCGSSDNRPLTDINIFTGTKGLEMEFMKNAPPPTAFEDGVFEVGVFLNNKGIYHIENGVVVLTLEED